MPVSRARKLAMAERRRQVADLYVKGWTQREIAVSVGVTQPTISADLSAIQAEWREARVRDFDAAREMELQKLDRIEREAWSAWESSKKPAQSAVVTGPGDQPSRKSIKNQNGDPRFLEQVHKCIAQRRALLGLDALPVVTENEEDAGLSLAARRDRFVAIFATLSDRAGVTAPGTAAAPSQPGRLCLDYQPGQMETSPASGLPG